MIFGSFIFANVKNRAALFYSVISLLKCPFKVRCLSVKISSAECLFHPFTVFFLFNCEFIL